MEKISVAKPPAEGGTALSAPEIAFWAGIAGGGGAGFPTHVKLSARAEYFIINAAECEPLIETDKFLIRTRAADLVDGAVEMARAVGAKSVVFAVKKAYAKETASLDAAIASYKTRNPRDGQPEISVFGMKTFYPAGDEHLITRLVTGKSIPERGIPLDVGAVVNNVSTALNFFDARGGKPVTHRVLSVTGAVRKPLMLLAPVGTPVAACVEAAGGMRAGSGVVVGGPMMGKYYGSADGLYIKKTDGNVLVLPPGHRLLDIAGLSVLKMQNRARSACIRCRMCTDLCPRYLTGHNVTPHAVMQNLYRIDRMGDGEEFGRVFGSALNCSECGLCELYSCPMLLSPRRVNAYVKTRLAGKTGVPERNMRPESREYMEDRMVPTVRLTARLGLSGYVRHLGDEITELKPERVRLFLKQHTGAPGIPVVAKGARVAPGDLIAAAPEGKLGCNLHASISGVVLEIDGESITVGSSGA